MEYTIAKALRHTTISSAEWSLDFGGPSERSIHRACVAKVMVYHYLDKENLKDHLEQSRGTPLDNEAQSEEESYDDDSDTEEKKTQ